MTTHAKECDCNDEVCLGLVFTSSLHDDSLVELWEGRGKCWKGNRAREQKVEWEGIYTSFIIPHARECTCNVKRCELALVYAAHCGDCVSVLAEEREEFYTYFNTAREGMHLYAVQNNGCWLCDYLAGTVCMLLSFIVEE